MSTTLDNGYRFETDSVGDLKVPQEVYYGVQSMRAQENFPITGRGLHPLFIKSLAQVLLHIVFYLLILFDLLLLDLYLHHIFFYFLFLI